MSTEEKIVVPRKGTPPEPPPYVPEEPDPVEAAYLARQAAKEES